MSQPSRSSQSPRSARRRLVRSIAFLVYAWLVVELGAWCGLWLMQGHRPSWSRQATRQRQALEAAAMLESL
ncbi:MAG: hypothetical protein GY711_02400 [bacterium]|nr:hypothetical protein [bacterium]